MKEYFTVSFLEIKNKQTDFKKYFTSLNYILMRLNGIISSLIMRCVYHNFNVLISKLVSFDR